MPATYTLRPAHGDDCDALTKLAQLDSTKPLKGDVMIAFAGDRPAAAMSLYNGRIIADPFLLTADAAALLRLYPAPSSRGSRRRAPRWRRLRSAPAVSASEAGCVASGPTRRHGRPARRCAPPRPAIYAAFKGVVGQVGAA